MFDYAKNFFVKKFSALSKNFNIIGIAKLSKAKIAVSKAPLRPWRFPLNSKI